MADTSLIGEIRKESPKQMFYTASKAVPDAIIETRYHAATDHDIPYLFYGVQCEDFEAFDAALVEDTSVSDPVVIAEGDGDRLYRVVPTPELLVVPELTKRGGAMLSGYCQNGAWYGRYQFPDRDTLVAMREYCHDNDVTFDVQQLYHSDGPSDWGGAGLTDPQREALLVAYEVGYFDDPRSANLEDIADRLGISSTAVGRRLRRGTSSLVRAVLVGRR